MGTTYNFILGKETSESSQNTPGETENSSDEADEDCAWEETQHCLFMGANGLPNQDIAKKLGLRNKINEILDDGNHNRSKRSRQNANYEDEGRVPPKKRRRLNDNKNKNENFHIKTVDDVLAWLHQIGFGQYVNKLRPQFEEDEVDGETLLLFDEDHLKAYGIKKVKDRIKIIKKIKELKIC